MAENKDGTEKTEDASEKRLREAREKGQVGKSQDVTTAGVILIGGITVFLLGKTMIMKLMTVFSTSLSSVGQFDFTYTNVLGYLISLFQLVAELMLPIMLVIVAIVLATEISQVGLKIATKKWSEPQN